MPAAAATASDFTPPSTHSRELPMPSSQRAFPARPILTHLNTDTTWLISLPYPSPSENGKSYYHILLDPWLSGPQSDVAAFFSRQWHVELPSVQNQQDLEDTIWRIENKEKNKERTVIGIDIIAISHEFTDHMHQATLLDLPKSVPVIASTKAALIIRSWKHFTQVIDLPIFNGNWQKSTVDLLPRWLGLSRIQEGGGKAYGGLELHYHSGILVVFSGTGNAAETEAVLYTPHGLAAMTAQPILDAEPKIQTVALLHGLSDISLPKAQLNMGAHNGLKVCRRLKARYWIGTHDEVKKGGGIVSWFLKRKSITLKEALDLEGKEGKEILREVNFVNVKNGERLVLE